MFTPTVLDSLPGPDWLMKERRSSLRMAGELEAPNPNEEAWRYSRIGELQLDRYNPHSSRPNQSGQPALDLDRYPEPAATLALWDGWIDGSWVSTEAAELGVLVGSVAEMIDGRRALESMWSEPVDRFGYLSRAFSPEPAAVVIPDGVRLAAPIVVAVHVDSNEAAVFPRLVIDIGRDASATVIELHTSADVDSLVFPVSEVVVGKAGKLRHGLLQNFGRRVWQVGHQTFRVEADASLEAFIAALGGDYARTRIDCGLVGRGAEGRLAAAYFGEGDQTLDFRTFQEHAAPDTSSDLLFKGVLDGASRSVYSGLIRIRPDAFRSRAQQTNRNVKLSGEAWAESVPNLEIETDEVVCSHASAISPVDAEQLFYLESRGVPTAAAERLIVEGFFEEIVAALPVPALEAAFRSLLAQRLDRRTNEAVG